MSFTATAPAAEAPTDPATAPVEEATDSASAPQGEGEEETQCQVYVLKPDATQCVWNLPLATTAAELRAKLVAEEGQRPDLDCVCTRHIDADDKYRVPLGALGLETSLQEGGAIHDDIRDKWSSEITVVVPHEATRRTAGGWAPVTVSAGWSFLS
jgi:hypothetical protein